MHISAFTPDSDNPDSKPGLVARVNRAYVTTLVHLTEVLCDPKCQVWCSPPLYTCRYRENSVGYREWKCLTLICLFVWRMWKLIIIISILMKYFSDVYTHEISCKTVHVHVVIDNSVVAPPPSGILCSPSSCQCPMEWSPSGHMLTWSSGVPMHQTSRSWMRMRSMRRGRASLTL